MKDKKISPSIVLGFAVGVLLIIPGLKSFGCCLILPLGAAAAVYLNSRFEDFSNRITNKKALGIGLATGFFAAIFNTAFDLMITFFTRTNDIIEVLPQVELMLSGFSLGDVKEETMNMLRNMEREIRSTGFSFFYSFFLLMNNLIINLIFGILGGLFGASFVNKKFISGENE